MPTSGLPPDEAPTVSRTALVLAANLKSLMKANPDLSSNPKLGKKTKLGSSAISRIVNGHNATMETLEALAAAFHLEPWQLLVRGFDPGNPPVLAPVTEAERRLHVRLKELMAELKDTQ